MESNIYHLTCPKQRLGLRQQDIALYLEIFFPPPLQRIILDYENMVLYLFGNGFSSQTCCAAFPQLYSYYPSVIFKQWQTAIQQQKKRMREEDEERLREDPEKPRSYTPFCFAQEVILGEWYPDGKPRALLDGIPIARCHYPFKAAQQSDFPPEKTSTCPNSNIYMIVKQMSHCYYASTSLEDALRVGDMCEKHLGPAPIDKYNYWVSRADGTFKYAIP